jgi:outer membrane scaffolding protein for murein synthesis (MipA/OmpV family)
LIILIDELFFIKIKLTDNKMIKYAVLALSLVSVSVFANSTLGSMSNVPDVKHEAKKGFNGQVGLGLANISEYVGAKNNESILVPLINVNYNDTFYIKFNRLGAWFYKSDNGFRVGGVLTRQAGYDKKELPDGLINKVGKEDTTLVGVNAQYKKGKFSAEAGFLMGMGDNGKNDEGSDGGKFYAQAGYTFLATSQYTLTGMVKVAKWDEDLVEYYYGNKDASTNVTVGLVGTYKLNDKWTMLGVVTAASLGDEITDSAIAEDDSSNMILLGATYSF